MLRQTLLICMNSSYLTDTQIIEAIQNGDDHYFERLYERYKRWVGAIIVKHIPAQDVEEEGQEVFLQVYQCLKNLKNPKQLKPWLKTISVRQCYDYWRKKYKSREVHIKEIEPAVYNWLERSGKSDTNIEELIQQKEARQALHWALDRLGPEDRMVIQLVYFEGLNSRQASQLLGWSTANVKIRSMRARRKLKQIIKL